MNGWPLAVVIVLAFGLGWFVRSWLCVIHTYRAWDLAASQADKGVADEAEDYLRGGP